MLCENHKRCPYRMIIHSNVASRKLIFHKSTLFKITFEISFMLLLHWKKLYKTLHILLKTTFEIPLFFIKEVHEQTGVFDYYKYGLHISCMINRWSLQIKLYVVVIFLACSFILFLNLSFSKYGLKILATFLTCLRADQKCD